MNPTLSRAQVRSVDCRAIDDYGVPGVVLMENAGRGAAELLLQSQPRGPVLICAGKGNNGGDGFVIARHLENRRVPVKVLLFCEPAELKGDARTNYQILAAAKTPLRVFPNVADPDTLAAELAGAEWIVDALLGTGTEGSIRAPYTTVIEQINASKAKVLSVDLPSGLDCDTGKPLGSCVIATLTATFVARKQGFDAPGARDWTGAVHVIDVGAPIALIDEIVSATAD